MALTACNYIENIWKLNIDSKTEIGVFSSQFHENRYKNHQEYMIYRFIFEWEDPMTPFLQRQ